MAGSRVAKFVDEDMSGKSPEWMKPSVGRYTEEMYDETYRGGVDRRR